MSKTTANFITDYAPNMIRSTTALGLLTIVFAAIASGDAPAEAAAKTGILAGLVLQAIACAVLLPILFRNKRISNSIEAFGARWMAIVATALAIVPASIATFLL